MTDKEKWYKSPWTISISTAVFSFLITLGYDLIKEIPILTTTLRLIKWGWDLVLEILNFNIKIWWLLILIAVVILIFYLINKLRNKVSTKPDFYNYREDILKNWKWSWGWEFQSYKNSWKLSNLKAHCPECNTPMIDSSNDYFKMFDCPRCDFGARDSDCEIPHKIERIIIDNIRRKRENRS